jgi:hypothetical protein
MPIPPQNPAQGPIPLNPLAASLQQRMHENQRDFQHPNRVQQGYRNNRINRLNDLIAPEPQPVTITPVQNTQALNLTPSNLNINVNNNNNSNITININNLNNVNAPVANQQHSIHRGCSEGPGDLESEGKKIGINHFTKNKNGRCLKKRKTHEGGMTLGLEYFSQNKPSNNDTILVEENLQSSGSNVMSIGPETKTQKNVYKQRGTLSSFNMSQCSNAELHNVTPSNSRSRSHSSDPIPNENLSNNSSLKVAAFTANPKPENNQNLLQKLKKNQKNATTITKKLRMGNLTTKSIKKNPDVGIIDIDNTA